MANNNEPIDLEPVISDDELKMPEETFGNVTPSDQDSSYLVFILGALIVILVLLLGGLYLWSSTMNQEIPIPSMSNERPTAEENNEPESNNAEADVETAAAMSTSDSLDAIEADLNSTELNDLDSGLNEIQIEMEANAQ